MDPIESCAFALMLIVALIVTPALAQVTNDSTVLPPSSPAHGAIKMPDSPRGSPADSLHMPVGKEAAGGAKIAPARAVGGAKIGAANSGEKRFRSELAACDQGAPEERRSCINGMWAARAEGLYRD